ncbi:hypothetical protein HW555_008633 [Spodoptera exigua]|uniref:Uncharacterized protein n=1 Tax=Spodoptera exigua TaxID=7107 RepID=A0A835GCN5_SPOEX|nr:hypothetical protein HW555_008633 [Spodoptera exigua]
MTIIPRALALTHVQRCFLKLHQGDNININVNTKLILFSDFWEQADNMGIIIRHTVRTSAMVLVVVGGASARVAGKMGGYSNKKGGKYCIRDN